MNTTTPQYEKEDILINFRDLLVYLLRRWKSALIGVLIITLLMTGYQYLRDYRAYQNALASNGQTATELSELSLANANQVLQYRETYQAQAEYNRSSLLMQINSGAVPTETVSYLITGTRSYVAATLLQNHLNDLSVYERVSAAIAPDSDPAQIMELVSATVAYDDSSAVADHALLSIKIIAPNKDLCNAIATELRNYLHTLHDNTAVDVGNYTLTLAQETFRYTVDNSLKTTQQNNLNTCNTLRNNLKTATDALSAQEKAYVERMSSQNGDSLDRKPTPPSVSKKALVLGFAAGVVLFVFLYGLGYVFDRRIKSREDFTERYGLYVFGVLDSRHKKRSTVTERLLRRLFSKKDLAADLPSRLALAQRQIALSARATAEKTPLTVYVTGTFNDADVPLLDGIKQALGKDGVKLMYDAADPLQDAAALNSLAHADAVLLTETVGVSVYENVYRTLALCERLDRPVLGTLLLQ